MNVSARGTPLYQYSPYADGVAFGFRMAMVGRDIPDGKMEKFVEFCEFLKIYIY